MSKIKVRVETEIDSRFGIGETLYVVHEEQDSPFGIHVTKGIVKDYSDSPIGMFIEFEDKTNNYFPSCFTSLQDALDQIKKIFTDKDD